MTAHLEKEEKRGMRDSCGQTGTGEEADRKQWRALRFYYVILLMQRTRGKVERGGPRASDHEKYYVPRSENES